MKALAAIIIIAWLIATFAAIYIPEPSFGHKLFLTIGWIIAVVLYSFGEAYGKKG